jgi:2'-5' RNA ligase
VTRTIGVAIAIPRPYADELERWRERFGDPAAHQIDAHITLLPPTRVDHLEPVVSHLDAIAARHAAFPVELRGTGTFRPTSPVVYVRVTQGAARIVTLESDIRSGPLRRSLRFEYHPHVTIAQDVPEEVLRVAQRKLADYEAAFTADAVTLSELAPSGDWTAVGDFPLVGA